MLRAKTLLLLLLAGGFFLQQLIPCATVADYFANRKYIASVLCENRNHPERHCNGKCHLRKQLSRTADKQNEKQRSDEASFVWEHHSVVAHIRNFSAATVLFAFAPQNEGQDWSSVLLRPPCNV